MREVLAHLRSRAKEYKGTVMGCAIDTLVFSPSWVLFLPKGIAKPDALDRVFTDMFYPTTTFVYFQRESQQIGSAVEYLRHHGQEVRFFLSTDDIDNFLPPRRT